jgi:hypothetical protein
MGRKNRLGPLQMSVARQDAAGVVLRAADERLLKLNESGIDLIDRLPLPEPKIGRHLIVPAAGGVELATGVAKPVDQGPLDVEVNVFEFDFEFELALLNFLANRDQDLLNLLAFVAVQQPDAGQHLGMGDRGLDIMRVEPAVEANAFAKLLDAAIRGRIEYARPSFRGHTRVPRGSARITTNSHQHIYSKWLTAKCQRGDRVVPGVVVVDRCRGKDDDLS